jgi:hypothetical protein
LLLLPSSHQIHITHVILIPTDKQLETVEAWLVEHGIEPDQAASATSSYFTTFNVASRPALARPGLFTELVEEQVRNAFGLWFFSPEFLHTQRQSCDSSVAYQDRLGTIRR